MQLPPEVESAVRAIYAGVGTPLSRVLLEHLDRGEWDAIAKQSAHPGSYSDVDHYMRDSLCCGLLKKCDGLPTSIDRSAAAAANWKLGESSCFRTNERLSPYLEGNSHPSCSEDVSRHVDGIRKKIALVLGVAPPMEKLNPRLGPGATYSDKSMRSTIADKFDNSPSITHPALFFLLDWIGTSWGREATKAGVNPVFVKGNRFTTAPKDALKHRAIAAEPSVNIFYQLGLGRALRRRILLGAGIDLDTAQDDHRARARKASLDGLSSTLDLKNASDTVSYNLVKLLIPPDWFRLLSELRSPFTEIRGKGYPSLRPGWYRLEKFSSMGNGFTFELETLLFWAIADYVRELFACNTQERTLVFGDDIIIDARCSVPVISLLRFLGFEINVEKSFVDGPFRESCGADFWDGRSVRPIYLRSLLNAPEEKIVFLNQLYSLPDTLKGAGGLLAWNLVWHSMPIRIRNCLGPRGLGDTVIHQDDPARWSWTSNEKTRIFAYQPAKFRRVSLRNFRPGTALAIGLYGGVVSSGYVTPRDSVSGYAIRKIFPMTCHWLPMPRIRRNWEIQVDSPSPLRGPGYGLNTRRVKRNIMVG